MIFSLHGFNILIVYREHAVSKKCMSLTVTNQNKYFILCIKLNNAPVAIHFAKLNEKNNNNFSANKQSYWFELNELNGTIFYGA